jgi:glycine betaine/proline transport system permease protein
MSVIAGVVPQGAPTRSPWPWVWATTLAATMALYLAGEPLSWAVTYPAKVVMPVVQLVNLVMVWLVDNLSWLTRAISAAMEVPLDLTLGLFAKSFTLGDGDQAVVIPRLSWVGIVAAMALAGYAYGGPRLALIGGLCFLYIALFGQWESAMLTLAAVAICVPVGVAAGLAAGIWAHRSPQANRLLITPLLDLMQTVPAFAYLVPVLLLFGFGPVTALIATVIFAMPPMVRATTLALSQVPAESATSATWSAARAGRSCGWCRSPRRVR